MTGRTSSCGRVLVVDDDERFRVFVSATLEAAGFESIDAADAGKRWPRRVGAFRWRAARCPAAGDLGLRGLPQAEGPVRRLTADHVRVGRRTEPLDRVAGLLLGSDDYLVKPFAPGRARRSRLRTPRRRGACVHAPIGNGWGLTPRETEVLGLLARGLGQAEIAARLVISPKTVGRTSSTSCSKTGARSRAQAVALAHGALSRRANSGAHHLDRRGDSRPELERRAHPERRGPRGRRRHAHPTRAPRSAVARIAGTAGRRASGPARSVDERLVAGGRRVHDEVRVADVGRPLAAAARSRVRCGQRRPGTHARRRRRRAPPGARASRPSRIAASVDCPSMPPRGRRACSRTARRPRRAWLPRACGARSRSHPRSPQRRARGRPPRAAPAGRRAPTYAQSSASAANAAFCIRGESECSTGCPSSATRRVAAVIIRRSRARRGSGGTRARRR